MIPALLWWTADLVPWLLGAAGTTAGLMAFSIERLHRRGAERLVAADNDLIAAQRKHIALLRERIGLDAAVASDVAALARHLTAAANQGLLGPERNN